MHYVQKYYYHYNNNQNSTKRPNSTQAAAAAAVEFSAQNILQCFNLTRNWTIMWVLSSHHVSKYHFLDGAGAVLIALTVIGHCYVVMSVNSFPVQLPSPFANAPEFYTEHKRVIGTFLFTIFDKFHFALGLFFLVR